MALDAPNLADMLGVVDLGARTQYDVFTGPAFVTPHGRAFGGQVIGQAVAAATQTVPADRLIHSVHGYFVRPGISERKMTFEVARLHEGRSFTTRRAQAYQDGQVLMSMIASFQEKAEGVEHQASFDMSGFPDPESLSSVWDLYGHLSGQGQASWLLGRPFDFRHIESDITLEVAERTSVQHVWMRSRDSLPDQQWLHRAALAFASDYLLLEPVLRMHGIPWATPGMRGMSLDHAMWFHRDFRVDDWLLYALDSPTAQDGRGLTHGRFYNRDGVLVASVSQETTLRLP